MVNRFEVVWTLATVGLVTGVAVWSTVLLYHIDTLPGQPDEYIDVVAHQWYWEFCYPKNGTCFNTAYDAATGAVSGGNLWATPGSIVQVNITATDVVHSFNVPTLGVRLDAIPGRENSIAFAVPNAAAGTQYLIQCTEFCGTFHGIMRAYLVLV